MSYYLALTVSSVRVTDSAAVNVRFQSLHCWSDPVAGSR